MPDSNVLLASIFERSLTLDRRGQGSGNAAQHRAMGLWERMAQDLDEIAANTRHGLRGTDSGLTSASAHRATRGDHTNAPLPPHGRTVSDDGKPARSSSDRSIKGGNSRRQSGQKQPLQEDSSRVATATSRRQSVRSQRDSMGRFVSAPESGSRTAMATANAKAQAQRNAEAQGGMIAGAVASGLAKLRGFGQKTVEAVTQNDNAKDAAGYAIGGPIYGAFKELKDALPDIRGDDNDDKQERREQAKEFARAVNAENGRRRDDKGRFKPDQNAARREIAQIEVAEAELAFEQREARADAKRHKELIRAIKANHRGMLDRFLDARAFGRRGRDRIIERSPRTARTRGGIDVDGRRRGRGRDVDIDIDRPGRKSSGRNARGRVANAELDLRKPAGRSLARAGGKRGILGGVGAAGGALARSGGAALGALGAVGKIGLRALPIIGQIAALGLTAYEGFQGWNDKDLHREAFGLKEGQEATTGQKASAAAASILDLGGITSGILDLFGVEFDKAGVARNIHQLGTVIATTATEWASQLGSLLPEVWSSIKNLGSRLLDGAVEIGTSIANFATGIVDKGMGMLSEWWTSGSKFVSDTWASVTNFAAGVISDAGGIISGIWKTVTELPGKIFDWAKEAAAGFIEKGGKLISEGWEGVKNVAGGAASWAKEKAGGLMDFASSAWDKSKSFFGGLFGASEAQADELPKGATAQEQAIKRAQEHWQSQNVAQPVVTQSSGILPQTQKEAVPAPTVPVRQPQSLPAAPQYSTTAPMLARSHTPVTTPESESAVPDAEKNKAQGSVSMPLEQLHMMQKENDAQKELNENVEALTEAVKKQTQLLDEERQARLMGDEYGIGNALEGMKNAIVAVRGGGGGYVSGHSGGGSAGRAGETYAYNPDSKLGDTIANFESGGKGINAIGYDRMGGTSYGKWQLSSRQGSYEEWLQLLESKGGEAAAVAQRLRAAGPTNTGSKSGAHVDAYLREAAAHKELFEATQRESLMRHNYNPALNRLKSPELQKMISGDKSLQEMLFSTAVQHGGGGAASIFNSVYRQGMSRDDLIRAVYAQRANKFGGSTASVQAGVRNRFVREQELILGMNAGEANVKALRERMSKGGAEAVQAGVSSMVAAATQDAMDRGVKYKMGAKNSAAGEIDCSGWVQEMGNQLMANMNAAAGEEVFSRSARSAFNQGAANEGAAGIVRAVSQQTGQLLTNADIAPDKAKEGMVIGLDTGHRGWEAGRFKDIDHIVQTYRDPETGELMVSESRGKQGVMRSRYADWYAQQQKRGTKLYAADMTAMADASKMKPAQPTAVADNAQAQPAASTPQPQPAPVAAQAQPAPTPVMASSVSAQAQPQPLAATAQSAGQVQTPASVAQASAPAPVATPTREPERVEAVRTIDPARESNGGDNAPLLAVLGKILSAIEDGNRKAESRAKDDKKTSDGAPDFGFDYADASARAYAAGTA